jgi:hypothetical protein
LPEYVATIRAPTAATCSRDADGAVVEHAMNAAAALLLDCPAAVKAEPQDALVRLGALSAAVQRLGAGGTRSGAAATLVGALAERRPELAGAALAAGAVPGLVALLGDADDLTAIEASVALSNMAGHAVASPAAAAAVDAGAVRALSHLLGRASMSGNSLSIVLLLLGKLVHARAGVERLVADGALPHVQRLLRAPARDVAGNAVLLLATTTTSLSWGAVAEPLLADAAAAPALLALLLGPDDDVALHASSVLGMAQDWAFAFGSPAALRRARGMAAAARRAGAVPRLVGLLRATLEGQQPRSSANHAVVALVWACHFDAAAAREALRAGAWAEACRVVVREVEERTGEELFRLGEVLVPLTLSLLADLATHLRDGAPRPAAAAEPGLVAALARVLGHAAARLPPGPGILGTLRTMPQSLPKRRRPWQEQWRAPAGPSAPPSSSAREALATWCVPPSFGFSRVVRKGRLGPCEDVDTAGGHAPKPLRLCSPGAHKHS